MQLLEFQEALYHPFQEMMLEWKQDTKALVPDILEMPMESLQDFQEIIAFARDSKIGVHGDRDYFERCEYYLVCYQDQLIGACAIRYHLTELGRNTLGNIAIGIRPQARQRGYAFQVLELLLEMCKNKHFPKVIVCHYAENAISQKLLEKAGAYFDGEVVSTVSKKKIKRYVFECI